MKYPGYNADEKLNLLQKETDIYMCWWFVQQPFSLLSLVTLDSVE
jgi:hypothetical protein